MPEPIFERVEALFRHHKPAPGYHQPQQPQEAPVSLATIEQAVRNFAENVKAEAEKAAPHLAALADIAQNASQSPLVQTALSAVLPPADEQMVVSLIQRLDTAAHTAEQKLGEPPAPEPEPEPAPEPVQPDEVPVP